MYKAPHTKGGQPYKTVEHGHGHSKAKYANDKKAAQQILDTDSAYTAHSIAKSIHAPGWDAVALPDLREHMKEKYQQNKDCMNALLDTGTKRLLELTWDKTWAVGYGLNSKLFHTDIQPGQNQTGYTLEELRTEFRDTLAAAARVHEENGATAGEYKAPEVVTQQTVKPPPPNDTVGAAARLHTPPKQPIALGYIRTTSPITNV